MGKFRKCPNCGRETIGTKCKWCHQPLTDKAPVVRGEAPRPKIQVAVAPDRPSRGPAVKDRAESHAASATMIVADAKQTAAKIMRQAEQTARDLATRVKAEADARSARVVADAQQRAEQIVREAEQAAA
jgi:vacuolar-type H+-ATPase subunit H